MRSRRFRGFHLSGVLRFGLLAFALGMSLPPVSSAQGHAAIQGAVSDSSGGAVPGVTIRIKNVETGAERNLVTDEAGRYNALALPAGRYEVSAAQTGFRSADETGILLSLGQRAQENLFLLNGVEFTGASEINNTPGGASGQLLGVEAVREFEVLKDTYSAEYGKRPGAQINIVTASGTNQLHGALYEFVRNSALDARNFFDQGSIPELQRNVFGGSLGGPVKREKVFLFGNYEGFRQSLGLSDVTLVPDDTSRASAVPSVQRLLALWPVANGPEISTATGAPSGIAKAFSNPVQNIREDFGTARYDQAFSNQDSFASV